MCLCRALTRKLFCSLELFSVLHLWEHSLLYHCLAPGTPYQVGFSIFLLTFEVISAGYLKTKLSLSGDCPCLKLCSSRICLSGSRCTGAAHRDGIIRAMALAFGSGAYQEWNATSSFPVAQLHKQDMKLEQKERLTGKLERRRKERIMYSKKSLAHPTDSGEQRNLDWFLGVTSVTLWNGYMTVILRV